MCSGASATAEASTSATTASAMMALRISAAREDER
jgi:hypothetical protein